MSHDATVCCNTSNAVSMNSCDRVVPTITFWNLFGMVQNYFKDLKLDRNRLVFLS